MRIRNARVAVGGEMALGFLFASSPLRKDEVIPEFRRNSEIRKLGISEVGEFGNSRISVFSNFRNISGGDHVGHCRSMFPPCFFLVWRERNGGVFAVLPRAARREATMEPEPEVEQRTTGGFIFFVEKRVVALRRICFEQYCLLGPPPHIRRCSANIALTETCYLLAKRIR